VDSKTNKKKSDAMGPKLVLIGVLSLVLVGVLYLQFGGSKKPKSAAKPRQSAAEKSSAKKSSELAKEKGAPIRSDRKLVGSLSQWKSPELAAVVVYDPFALPAAFPRPAATVSTEVVAAKNASSPAELAKQRKAAEDLQQKMQAQLESLKHQGVHVIIKGRDEYVAVIGDQEIRVGDEINGFKVLAIDSNSVRVAWEPN
jgi:hypothetical protein